MANPIPTAAREAVYVRGNRQCAMCGMRGAAIHHRKRRREGGHDPSNLVLLCNDDHRWVHSHPQQARARGYMISAFTDDVAVTPVHTFAGPMLYHDDWTVTYL